MPSARNIVLDTGHGVLVSGDSVNVIQQQLLPAFKGKIDLILTSTPYPLNPREWVSVGIWDKVQRQM